MGAHAARRRQQEDRDLPDASVTSSVAEESKLRTSFKEVSKTQTSDIPKNPFPGSPEQRANLEDQFVAEKQRSCFQQEEMSRMNALVEHLEAMVDRQVTVTENEQERITVLEQAMGQQQTCSEEKVAKLLLAVAGEKHRADIIEQERLHQEQTHQAVVEELCQQLEATRATAMNERDSLKKQLLAECALHCQAEQRVVGLEQQVKTLQQDVEQLTTEAMERGHAETELLTRKVAVGENAAAEAIVEVMGQCQIEMVKRMDAQNKLLQRDQQLRELQRKFDESSLEVTSRSTHRDKKQLVAQQDTTQHLEIAETEARLQKLERQLAGELAERMHLQDQVAEKDTQLRDMQFMVQDTDLKQHHAAQDQLLQRTRELCDLQAQLAQELALRQDVQYSVLDLQRVICDLQRQLTNITERSLARGVGDGSSVSPSEPEGEDYMSN